MQRHIGFAIPEHHHLVHIPVTTTKRALRPEPAMIHNEAGFGVAVAKLQLVIEPEPAAHAARSSRPFMERIMVVEHRKCLLHDLDRRCLGNTDGGTAITKPVAIGIAAIAATGQLVHDEITPAFGIMTTKREIPACTGRRRRHPVGKRLDHRRKYRFGNSLADLGSTPRDRSRIMRIKECALITGDIQRLERAGADRHFREDVPHGQIDRTQCRRQNRVHRPTTGRARPGKVKPQPVIDPDDGEPDLEWLVNHAVAVDIGHRLPASLGHCGDHLAHLRRGAAAQLGDCFGHRVIAIAAQKQIQPVRPYIKRGSLCLHITNSLVCDTDVGTDDGVDFFVHDAFLEQLYRWQSQPFLFNRGRRGREPTRHGPARIRPMSGIRQPAPQLAVTVIGTHKAHIHEMRATKIRVVDDVYVARLRCSGTSLTDQPDQLGRRILHRPDKDGQTTSPLRNQGTVIGGIDAIRPVIRLGNDR